MKKLLFSASVVMMIILVASCDKDQRTVGKLDGKWVSNKVTVDNLDVTSAIEITLDFVKCKQKKGDGCPATFIEKDISSGQQISTALKYSVDDKGETLKTIEQIAGAEYVLSYNMELKKSKLILDWTHDGHVKHVELEKQ